MAHTNLKEFLLKLSEDLIYNPHDGREDLEAGQYLDPAFRIHRGGSFRDAPDEVGCSQRSYPPGPKATGGDFG